MHPEENAFKDHLASDPRGKETLPARHGEEGGSQGPGSRVRVLMLRRPRCRR